MQYGVTQTGHINQHNFNRGAAAGKTYSFNKVINIKLNESLNTNVNIDVIQNIRGLKFKGVQNKYKAFASSDAATHGRWGADDL